MKRIFHISMFFFFFACFGSYGGGKVTSAVNNSVSPEKTYLFDQALQDHPRLLFSIHDEQRIKQLKQKDPLLKDLIALLKVKADQLLKTPMVRYELRSRHSDLLMISREHVYRIITLSLAYRMFGDKQYAAKAEENLINVCNYPDWDPKHFLDVAEMTEAVAIGYDWLYNVLPNDTKVLIRKSLKEKALNRALQEYATGDADSWAKRETNWNVVCNTGMIMAALAIAEDELPMAEKIISEAVSYLPNSLNYYAPDGVWYEGMGYWDYTSSNLAMLLSSLNISLGHDYGLSEMPGISKTAGFYVSALSPAGQIFNFADAVSTTPTNSPVFFYFSRRYNQPSLVAFYRNQLSKIVKSQIRSPKWHFFLCIPWYDNAITASPEEKPALQIFEDVYNPMMVFNGKNTASNSIFLITKGGMSNLPHQHLDAGSFVVETNGVRWLDDPGATADDYALPGFWDYTPVTGQRWKYFRYNNFGHNTLSIDGHLQYSAGKAKILRYDKNTAQAFGIIDMTAMYINLASKVYRGFKLLSDDLMLIQDEVSLAPGSNNVEWTAITTATITVDGNTATLQKEEKSFYLKIISPVGATFITTEAKANTADESPVDGYSLLRTTVSPADGTNQTIRMVMSSNSNTINNTNLTGDFTPLTNWK
ncbi:MAG: heparinase II/III family protein [Paludibacter sp.]|nr:heparinase II/III family protein [Paludibacter sp.]